MRVAHVNQDPGIQPGRKKGAAIHVEAMRVALGKLGVAVEVVDARDDEATGTALLEAHARGSLDLVYERYSLGARAAARFASVHKIPFVLEVNAPLLDEERWFRRGTPSRTDIAAETAVFSSAQRILAVSTEVADYVARRGVPRARIRVTPNGIDPDVFNPEQRDERVRAEIAKPGEFVLGFHGRLRPWHGLRHLARVVQGLCEEGLALRIVALGEGPFADELAGVIDPRAVTLVGWKSHGEVARYVAAFDCAALSYDPALPFYFSPLKLGEAMASGAVPIVPELGDLPRCVRHMHNGLVYPPGDWGALGDSIGLLARDRALCATLAERAVASARERSWTAIAREVLEVVAR